VILIFTRDYGKISVGTSINEKGRSKSSLAIRPFTFGNYQIFDGRTYYNLDSCETKKSYYAFGEDLDKFSAASYVLELTDHMLPEGLPQPKLFSLLTDFMAELEGRKKKYGTLVIAYEIKALSILGVFPELDNCVICGEQKDDYKFSIASGGLICKDCLGKMPEGSDRSLIYDDGFGIVKLVKYFDKTPLQSFSGIALADAEAERLHNVIREYMAYHLELGKLKSEGLFSVVDG
jgi:DNA repair protein RecO (recombination protein O)